MKSRKNKCGGAVGVICLVAVLAVMIPGGRADDSTAYAPPAGFIKAAVAGHGASVIGAPLLREAVAAGRVTACGSNSITVSDAAWGQNQFADSDEPHYLEVVDGNLAGCVFPIIGNSADTLLLDSPDLTAHPLGALAADTFATVTQTNAGAGGLTTGALVVQTGTGNLVRVRRAWTVGALLDQPSGAAIINPALSGSGFGNAETLSIPDNHRLGTRKPPAITLVNVSGAGYLDKDGADWTNLVVPPGTALIAHRFGHASGLDFVVVGNVQTAPFALFVPGLPALSDSAALSGTGVLANDFYFSPVIPEPVALADTGLAGSGGIFQSSDSFFDRKDELIGFASGATGVFNPDADRAAIYLGDQWREAGTDGPATLQIEPGRGYVIRRKPGAPDGYWILAPD